MSTPHPLAALLKDKKYSGDVADITALTKPYHGKSKTRAIILGADPTHIINDKPVIMEKVFGLEKEESPYWRSIQRNLDQLNFITIDNLYVQNVCQNYFKCETSKNKEWLNIAREYWIPFLKEELDGLFDPEVPVLLTTEFILKAVLKDPAQIKKAKDIYTDKISFPPTVNRLGREMFAFYRHYKYGLGRWKEYGGFLDGRLG